MAMSSRTTWYSSSPAAPSGKSARTINISKRIRLQSIGHMSRARTVRPARSNRHANPPQCMTCPRKCRSRQRARCRSSRYSALGSRPMQAMASTLIMLAKPWRSLAAHSVSNTRRAATASSRDLATSSSCPWGASILNRAKAKAISLSTLVAMMAGSRGERHRTANANSDRAAQPAQSKRGCPASSTKALATDAAGSSTGADFSRVAARSDCPAAAIRATMVPSRAESASIVSPSCISRALALNSHLATR